MRSLLFLLAAAPLAAQSDSLLANPRQLTFSGKRAGEGYFSADGKRMVFQSERDPANPFYQIYLLDFATGEYVAGGKKADDAEDAEASRPMEEILPHIFATTVWAH